MPVSPSMSTVTRVSMTFASFSKSCRMALLSPIIPSKRFCTFCLRYVASLRALLSATLSRR